jgi:anti-sigma factor RsiW
MSCAEMRPLIEAAVDGELSGRDALDVERHLAECAACAQTLKARLALREAIAAADLRQSLPAGSEARLRDTITGARAPARSPVRDAAGWRQLAAAAAMVLVALGGFTLGRQWPRETTAGLADAAVSSHVRSLLGGRPEDVLSSDHHTVKPWFTGKLDFAPEVIDLGGEGFRLSGGRLDDVAGRRVAALVYHAGAHQISLFTWPSAGSGCGEPGAAEVRRGFRVVTWACGGMAYVAVSDAAEGTLHELARGIDAAVARAAPASR